MKTLLASILLLQVASTAAAVDAQAPAGGVAIGDMWEASAAEYQASAEGLLETMGARNIREASLSGSMLVGFLQMFGGGGGAPQDLVSPRTDALLTGAGQ